MDNNVKAKETQPTRIVAAYTHIDELTDGNIDDFVAEIKGMLYAFLGQTVFVRADVKNVDGADTKSLL